MNLYLIHQTINADYESYTAAIVVAEDRNEAKVMHPAGKGRKLDDNSDCTWVSNVNDVHCQYLGVAKESDKPGVIYAYYYGGDES
jgi:hypothetical protein